jgi:adenylosuccinate lyase
VKEEGADNDLLSRIAKDNLFAAVHNTLGDLLEPSLFVGRAPQQVKEFIADCVDPILTDHAAELSKTGLDSVNV